MSSSVAPNNTPVTAQPVGQNVPVISVTTPAATSSSTVQGVSVGQPLHNATAPAVFTGPTVVTAAMMTVINARNAQVAHRTERFNQVSEAITAPPTTTSYTRVTDTGVTDVFIVPVLPETASVSQKKLWMLYLASGLKSVRDYKDREMTVQVIAMFHTLYPTSTDKTQNVEWSAYVLTSAHIAMLETFYNAGLKFPTKDKGPGATKTALENLRSLIMIPHTLGVKTVTLDFFRTDLDWLMFHGYAGLLLFTMHKATTATSSAALMVARPLALCRKYSRENGSYTLWVESGRPSQTAYAICTTMWKLIPATRYALMLEFAQLSEGRISAENEALFTTVRLMQWTDLSHIPIINEALTNFDLLRACPLIAGDIAAYQAGIIQLVDMMPYARDTNRNIVLDNRGNPVRDLTTMSYVKALWGDRKTLAQRGTMPVLLGVALALLSPTRTSLRTYTGPVGYADRIQDVKDWYDKAIQDTRSL